MLDINFSSFLIKLRTILHTLETLTGFAGWVGHFFAPKQLVNDKGKSTVMGGGHPTSLETMYD